MADPMPRLHRLSIPSMCLSVLLAPTGAQAEPAAPAAPPAAEPPTAPAGAGAALALQRDLITVAKRVFPSVLTVRSFVRKDLAAADATSSGAAAEPEPQSGWVLAPSVEREYPDFAPLSSCSGFFVSDDGDVLTALQPLQTRDGRLADLFEIESTDGQRAIAEVVGIEPTLNLAVLRGAVFTTWEQPTFQPLAFGDSDALELGSLLIGAGDPLGPERFFASGMLVAKPSRDCYQELMSATYMQATMFVPDGAIGGPMLDLDGRVVGILSRIEIEGVGNAVSQGSAWALPSKILQGLYESIREAGTTQSPWLGFSVMSRAEIATVRGFQTFQRMQKPPHGILIENVFEPSPAAAAGVGPDDWLTHFGDVEIHMPVQFQRQLYLAGVGRGVRLRFFRAGETIEKTIVIDKRPPDATPR